MNKRIYNKRGDISETIVWFGAFLAIIFIMAIFLSLTLVGIGMKKIPFIGPLLGYSGNEISMNQNFNILREQNELVTLLNTPLSDRAENRQTVEDLIIQWKILGETDKVDNTEYYGLKTKIETQVKEILEKNKANANSKYLFYVENVFVPEQKGYQSSLNSAGSSIVSLNVNNLNFNDNDVRQSHELEIASSLNLYYGGKKANIMLYIKDE